MENAVAQRLGDVAGEIDAIIEASPEEMHDSLVRAYLAFPAKNQSALVVSQTRGEVRALNESIRAGLQATGGIKDDQQLVAALESTDLTPAQKLDSRFCPKDHVLVFNHRVAGCDRGARGRMLAASQAGIIVEVGEKIRLVKPKHADHLTVCTPQPLHLSPKDRLQLKANAKAVGGEVLANGEVLTVRKIRASGEIALEDGRILPELSAV